MYEGRVIDMLVRSLASPARFFTPRRCKRYVFPLESTTCQCGSGVSGTLKSSDSVRTFLPSFVACVTVPPFTLEPENGLLVWLCASANVAVMASAAMPKSPVVIVRRIIRSSWILWLVVSDLGASDAHLLDSTTIARFRRPDTAPKKTQEGRAGQRFESAAASSDPMGVVSWWAG